MKYRFYSVIVLITVLFAVVLQTIKSQNSSVNILQFQTTPTPGYFDWPREKHEITSSLGSYRGNHLHSGIDLKQGQYTPVHPSAAGEVVFKDFVIGAGNVVTIEHSNGLLTNYLHLNDVGFNAPSPGVSVTEATPIGLTGNTGGNYPYHLHFEIRESLGKPTPGYNDSGTALNPLDWLPESGTPVPDSNVPYLNHIIAIPEGSNSKVWVKTPAPNITPLSTPAGALRIGLPGQTTPIPKIINARGRIQFLLNAKGKTIGADQMGVYDIGYRVAGSSSWNYHIRFDELKVANPPPPDDIHQQGLIYNETEPFKSYYKPTPLSSPAPNLWYRLFLDPSVTATPTPSVIVETDLERGVFNTLNFPNGTPVVLRFEAVQKALPGYPTPVRKIEEIVIIPLNADRWVDCEAGDDFSNDCSDDANPCLTITHALAVAQPGEVIAVAPGYCENSDGEIFPLNLKEGITLEGSGYSLPSNGGTVIQSSTTSSSLIFCDNLNIPPVIDGFFIAGGYHGINLFFSDPFILNCQIMANVDSGIRCGEASFPEIVNCLIRSNSGPGISIIDTGPVADVFIRNSTIVTNQDGIACLPGASATIIDSVVCNNGGYGLFINSLSEGSIVENCDFWNNSSGNWNLSPYI